MPKKIVNCRAGVKAESRLRAIYLEAQAKEKSTAWIASLPRLSLDLYPGDVPTLREYSDAERMPPEETYSSEYTHDFYRVWQPPADAALALLHLGAGPAACVKMPMGAYMVGGVCTAATAPPRFNCAGELIDFTALAAAGKEIRALTKLWHSWDLCEAYLTTRLGLVDVPLKLLRDYLGVEQNLDTPVLAQRVASILVSHGLRIDDSEYDTEANHIQNVRWGTDGNWAWLFSHHGYAPYARADVDFYIAGETLADAERSARLLAARLLPLVGDCVAVRTANTITLAPSWPARHVQLVTLALPSLSAAFLFADLDCTAVAFNGCRFLGCQRFIRAIRRGANEVPAAMIARRPDTKLRICKYVDRGFSPSPADVSPDLFDDLHDKIMGYMRLRRKYLKLQEDTAEASDEHEAIKTSTLLWSKNTGYEEYRIPRGLGVTPDFLRAFLAARAPESILHSFHDIRCTWRLDRTPENWVFWGMAAQV